MTDAGAHAQVGDWLADSRLKGSQLYPAEFMIMVVHILRCKPQPCSLHAEDIGKQAKWATRTHPKHACPHA